MGALSSGTSFLLSSVIVILLFSGMQANKQWLITSPVHTVFGGAVASILFLFSLTAVSNLETVIFGETFQAQLFPEVCLCYLFTLFSASMVHRVCVTTAFLFSSVLLYYVNSISQKTYAVVTNAAPPPVPARRKKH